MGTVSLGIAPWLAMLIQAALRHFQQHGATEMAADARMLLCWPWLLASIGVVFLIQAIPGTQQPLRREPPPGLPPAPPHRQQTLADPYRQACALLGVPPHSSWGEIRSRWRRQLMHWHPDHGGDPELWHQRVRAYEHLKARHDPPMS